VELKVIAVLGRSYCGSSILNLVLGSHSCTFGAGELYRTVMRPDKAYCAICRGHCSVWTPDTIQRLNLDNVYETLAKRTGADTIIDSSKVPGWFSKAMNARTNVEFIPTLLVKHPLRHISSFVANQFFRDESLPHRDAPETRQRLLSFANEQLRKTLQAYTRILDNPTFQPHGPVRILAYESFVADPDSALKPTLNAAGLEFEPRMLEYLKQEHHPVGGNTGAHLQLRLQGKFEKQARHWIEHSNPDRSWRRYYAGTAAAGLNIDDKFRETLREEEVSAILAQVDYQRLCAMLGYQEKIV
jgi:hypothetical protein